jgi:hypothetical protein
MSVIVSRQMNPTSGCPRPPEPPVQDAGPVAFADTFFGWCPTSVQQRVRSVYALQYPPVIPSMLDPLLIVELGLLGLGTGFLAGLLGHWWRHAAGALSDLHPGRKQVAPDLAVKMAIATSMATIVFTSVSSVRAHHKRGAVRWDIVKRLAPGIVLGGFVASLGVFSLLKGSFLASSLACL